MYSTLRPLLFRIDPERLHVITIHLLRLAGSLPPIGRILRFFYNVPDKPVQAFGLTFSNPVGLAAGYDKDGLAWRGLASLGFGHIEVGTVTPLPQAGNPRPRLFRLSRDHALINRMGFPSRGAEFVARQIKGSRVPGLVVGVNLGKNQETALESAVQDYLFLVDVFAPLADFLVINVSSPNTIGLRRLQARQALDELLAALDGRRLEHQQQINRRVPLLVKLSPDLSDAELDDALDVIMSRGMDGVVATNTTVSREGIRGQLGAQAGGLSGVPLRTPSTEMIRKIHNLTGGEVPIIGVGGIVNAGDAREKLDAGAVLVQIYTGLVYRGPAVVKQIVSQL